MPSTIPIPAAQYLRMSTEHQGYSLESQSQTIAKYADAHGFSIVHTYSDPALSGVLLRRRKGLQKLIQDVVQGQAAYKAILVYDVSRWGRFLDTDESAHYEFLCKSAGVRVHYCAETFLNDDAMPNIIMKSLKRAMAGEFSREMGVKVFAGQSLGAQLGFRQGAIPGYGLRRYLVSSDRTPKQPLGSHERKSLATDRVILVPGPASEVRCVRRIYRMFVEDQMTYVDIARELNRGKIKFVDDKEWNPALVKTILNHPKYVGWNVYGRTTRRLYTPEKRKPRAEWITVPGAFKPIIKPSEFAVAQRLIARKRDELPRNRSDKALLDALRRILDKHGRITIDLIDQTPAAPSSITYRKRFGTLGHAYELIGYTEAWVGGWLETRRRIRELRADLMKQIAGVNTGELSIEKHGARSRTCLRTKEGQVISVIACRPVPGYKGAVRWFLHQICDEAHMPVLAARLDLKCRAFKDLFLIPPLRRAAALYPREDDPRLQGGFRLANPEDFAEIFRKLTHNKLTH